MTGVINLRTATQHPSEDQVAFQARLDTLVKELEEALAVFVDGHPALTPQYYTLATHERDFYLPPRRMEVQAHVVTELQTNVGLRELVIFRSGEDSMVSYGLFDGLVAANPMLAQCVILKPARVKDLFIPAGASVDNEDHAETIRVGIANLEAILEYVKRLSA